MKTRVYLDTCCYGRLFDDQNILDIRRETDAIAHVQQEIQNDNIELAWSFVLDYENARNPRDDRKADVASWKAFAVVEIRRDAETLQQLGRAIEKKGIHTMDALHIACAIKACCRFFLTTDKKLLNKRVEDITILNPLSFVQEKENNDG